MSLPDGVDTVTLTSGANGLTTPDGTPFAGTVTLTPSVDRVTSSVHGLIVLGPANATLSASGTFALGPVLATDADDFTPTGWTYRVDENFNGQPPRSYSISLPAATPTVVLPDVAPTSSTTGTAVSPSVLSVNGETGIVVLDATDVGAVPTSRQVIAGTGLTGGGSLAADRTLNVVYGASAGTACEGDDARLSDARTPLAHAASHASEGSDPVTPAGIGAEPAGTAASAVAAHAGASDPHGDRAWADSRFATIIVVTELSGDVSTLDGFVQDCLTRVAAIEQGTAFLAALNVAGNAQVANGNLTVTDFVKGYRFRVDGSALDLEATGTDLIISNWSGTGFNGTQRSYARLSADAHNTQWAGKFEFVDALYNNVRHTIDGAGNTLGFHGATPVAQQTVTGSRGDGTALANLLSALDELGLIVDSTTA
jgi:hypothetical protein